MLAPHSTQSLQTKHPRRQFCMFALWRMACFPHKAQALMRQIFTTESWRMVCLPTQHSQSSGHTARREYLERTLTLPGLKTFAGPSACSCSSRSLSAFQICLRMALLVLASASSLVSMPTTLPGTARAPLCASASADRAFCSSWADCGLPCASPVCSSCHMGSAVLMTYNATCGCQARRNIKQIHRNAPAQVDVGLQEKERHVHPVSALQEMRCAVKPRLWSHSERRGVFLLPSSSAQEFYYNKAAKGSA